jgi:hypothetical protein
VLSRRIADLTQHLKTHAKDHASRRGLLVLAFLLGLAGSAVCLIAAYAPIFSLAGRIQAQ